MKRLIKDLCLSAVLLAVVSCGSSSRVTSYSSNEEVELGYGTIKRDMKTNSSSTVNAKDSETTTYNNMLDYLRGRVPGLNISPNGDINIRGIGSPNSDGTPLFIVDGVITPSIEYINPMEVKSVEVIKDGTSAIYGMQGANGVIIITTKK